MDEPGRFPFGERVQRVAQDDRTPKRVFVLGVYASAVHARWVDARGATVVKALAVASEPYIFWRGEGAEGIVARIAVPEPMGRLVRADRQFNGPSGEALDSLILQPLGLSREDAWLCDLVPYSCMNPQQKRAIDTEYAPWVAKGVTAPATTAPVPRILATEERVKEITRELLESQAERLIVLGDEPIRWYLRKYASEWARLADFGDDDESYGRIHEATIDGRKVEVLPLAHPRQIAKLGDVLREMVRAT